MVNKKEGRPESHSASSNSQVRLSVTENVYTALKHDIMWGKIESGTLLSELKLAARFGVSRTPVREALTMLASDGLINTLPRRGHLVRTISLSEMLNAFRVRELLEVEAVAQAVRRISDREIARLRELAKAGENTDIPDLNRQFHVTIARASGNRILADFIERLLILMQSVLIRDPRYFASRTEEGIEEELAIVNALAARDEEAAREAMRRHIRNTLSAILRET